MEWSTNFFTFTHSAPRAGFRTGQILFTVSAFRCLARRKGTAADCIVTFSGRVGECRTLIQLEGWRRQRRRREPQRRRRWHGCGPCNERPEATPSSTALRGGSRRTKTTQGRGVRRRVRRWTAVTGRNWRQPWIVPIVVVPADHHSILASTSTTTTSTTSTTNTAEATTTTSRWTSTSVPQVRRASPSGRSIPLRTRRRLPWYAQPDSS